VALFLLVRLVYKADMATKAKTKKTEFPVFVRMMAKALRMGREHRTSRRAQSTPLELAVNLKVPGAEARSLYVLYLRESYLAGYNFERD
jgi:hypothetical protein